MPDYPGVDPDGLNPGGLQVAGRVNAHNLAVGGLGVVPSAVSWGSWSNNAGVLVHDNATSTIMVMDTENRASPDITYDAVAGSLAIASSGIYLLFADTYVAVSFVAGVFTCTVRLSAGVQFPFIGQLNNLDIFGDGANGMNVCSADAGSTIEVTGLNKTGADATMSCDVVAVRLL